MSAESHTDYILQAIDHLRHRKARPDLKRICHMVNRKHGLNSTDTELHLEKLVDAQIVVKVDYKGNTSYRNASKNKRSHFGVQLLNSSMTGKLLVEGVRALTQGDREKTLDKQSGTNIRDIEKWLISQPEFERDSIKCPLHVMLQREVDAGKLEKLPNGNYAISPHGSKAGKMKALLKRCVSNPSRRGRPPKKKKIRRFYSYEPEPPSLSSSSSAVSKVQEQLCDFCQQSSASNKTGGYEELLICKDCNAKAHPSCMEYSPILAQRAQLYPWQCIDCKTCCLCEDSGDGDSMLFCDGCDKGFHMNCHCPPVLDKPLGKWICSECKDQGIELSDIEAMMDQSGKQTLNGGSNGFISSGLPTPRDSPAREIEIPHKSKTCVSLVDEFPSRPRSPKYTESSMYPDASKWSIADVASFFESIGYKEQAAAFKEQEIDGQSLLLMKRSDVLTGLSIRLGPALKIYQHVVKLQTMGPHHSMFL